MIATREVARTLVAGLNAQLPAEGFSLRGFEVEVGALVELDVALLLEALLALVPGVDVQLVRVPAVLKCLDCGAEYPVDESPCPVCGSARAELIRGNELQVKRAWGERIA